MTNVKIARQAYLRAPQGELSTFAAHVVARMLNVPAYESIQPEVQALATAHQAYSRSLVAATNRGVAERWARGLAKTNLLKALDTVAKALATLAADNSQLIVEAGFPLVQSTAQRFSGRLAAPTIAKAGSTGRKGEVRVVVTNEVPQIVRTQAIELSYDRGQTWLNGTYNSYRSFTLTGLQYSPELWLRVAAIGAGEAKSSWSEPVVVSVV